MILNREIFRDKIVAVVGPGHHLAGQTSVTPKAVAEFFLVLTEASFRLRQQIVFDRHGISPRTFCVSLVKGIAGLGSHCTLLPRFAVEAEIAAGTVVGVPVRELVDEVLVFCLCMLKARVLSPAASIFADAIVEFCRRYSSR